MNQKQLTTTNNAWSKVLLSRHKNRPATLAYINALFDFFIELHGDRSGSDDQAIIGGLATIGGVNVTVVGHQRGKGAKDIIARRNGMAFPGGYRKAIRLMKQAEKFNRPIITFVDTPGAFAGVEAEQKGQGQAIAHSLLMMAGLKVPILAIIISQGGSGGALGLAVANQVWMLENAYYSILSPEGFATILWKDSKKASKAATLMQSTAKELKDFGLIDKIIKEPIAGIHTNPIKVFMNLQTEIITFLNQYKKIKPHSIVKQRYDKFRKMGEYELVKKVDLKKEIMIK